jgi:ABC-type antimicrobial peptide transport system permease subunit
MAFIPLLQDPPKRDPDRYGDRPYAYGNELDVRVAGNPVAIIHELQHAISEIDHNIPVFGITTLTQRIDDSTRDAKAAAQLSGLFGLLALLLASIGLYGVMAHNVSRRTHEIGVRMAVGAQAGDVEHMVLRESFLVVIVGIFLGIPAALGIGRLISSQLFGLSSHDSLTLVFSALLLLSASVIASYLPARRAARTNPIVALRHE